MPAARHFQNAIVMTASMPQVIYSEITDTVLWPLVLLMFAALLGGGLLFAGIRHRKSH